MDSATNSASDAAAAGIFGGLILIIIVVTIALVVFFVWLFWRIFARTGMNGALGLLCRPSKTPIAACGRSPLSLPMRLKANERRWRR